MKPSREEVLKLWDLATLKTRNGIDAMHYFAVAMYEAGAAAERAVSDRLLKALKKISSERENTDPYGKGYLIDRHGESFSCTYGAGHMVATNFIADISDKAIAEVEAMRKEKPE